MGDLIRIVVIIGGFGLVLLFLTASIIRLARRGSNSGVYFLTIILVLLAAGATFILMPSFGGQSGSASSIEKVVTFVVVHSATPNSTIPVIVVDNVLGITPADSSLPVTLVTVPAPPGTQVANVPPGILETEDTSRTPLPTIDSTLIAPNSSAQRTVTALPSSCLPHVVQEGDTPFAVALLYGADPFRLLAVNGIDEESATGLQIGQVLIVPLEGCPLESALPTEGPEATATQTPTATPTGPTPTLEITFTPSPSPTITLAPTAASAQIEIIEVLKRGDVTAEGVRIRNLGNTVNVNGWTLSDSQGNVYTFPDNLIFSNGEVTVYTRTGQNTPVSFFWGRDEAVWGDAGDILTLTDAEGRVQASVRLQ